MAEREIFQLSDTLREYMLDELTKNPSERENVNVNKYRNLRLVIDTEGQIKEPNFKVQMGILEAIFTIEEGLKLVGSLGATDEVLVNKWLDMGSSKSVMRLAWLGESVDKRKGKITPFDMD